MAALEGQLRRFNLELSMQKTKRGLNIILLDHKTEVSSSYYASNRGQQTYTTEYAWYSIKAICIHCSAHKS